MRQIVNIIILCILGYNLSMAQDSIHDSWNNLLKKHVDRQGKVNYIGFKKDEEHLDKYLSLLSKSGPGSKWNENQKLSFWINAYNAYTVKLILNYSDKKIKSIKDIGSKIKIPFVNTAWDIKFIEIQGKKYDLNNIEHGIIRKHFDEPRIHFALVCAAKSCPSLRNEAYIGSKLSQQLDEQAKDFINDKSKNDLKENKAEISEIFKWYKGDFKNENMIDYLNKYSVQKVNSKTNLKYKKYDWDLNGPL
jgi:hypothetical protein